MNHRPLSFGLGLALFATACQQTGAHDAVDTTELSSQPLLTGAWADKDIGSVGMAGSATLSGTTFTVKGSGADVFGTADAFHFGYQQASGDVSITAKVTSLQTANTWTKAVVMIRQSLAPDAAYVAAVVSPTPANLWRAQVRSAAKGATTSNKSSDSSVVPSFLRVVRTGGNFVVGYSTDGKTWKTVPNPTASTPSAGQIPVSMTGTVFVGIGVTSHDNTKVAQAVFDSVKITGTAVTCPAGQKACGSQCVVSPGCCTNADCGTGNVCANGSCVCGPGFRACNGSCIAKEACCGDTDCPTGQACLGGRCGCPAGQLWCGAACQQCCSNDECASGQVCNGGSCSCPAGTQLCTDSCGGGKSCRQCCDNSQCGNGKACIGGACACPTGTKLCGNGQCQACCADTDCVRGEVCSAGACKVRTDCGGPGQPCCDLGANSRCVAGFTCNKAGNVTCVACGGAGQPCCEVGGCTAGQLTCIGDPSNGTGTCQACGNLGQACCGGTTCAAGSTCQTGQCTACGQPGQQCCGGNTCLGGNGCTGGVCGACGQPGQKCCDGNSCAGGGACLGGQCLTCGQTGQPCCGSGNGSCTGNNICQGNQCAACGQINQPCCGSTCSGGLACDPTRLACVPAEWSPWINRDDPLSGNGDGEHLSLMLSEMRHVCPSPLGIECRRASDQVDYLQTGETISFCDRARGLECLNASQTDGRCDDYEVRFLCPLGTIQ